MLEKKEDAYNAFNKAIECNPNNANSYNNRGVAASALNWTEEAISAYQQAMDLNPNEKIQRNNKVLLESISWGISDPTAPNNTNTPSLTWLNPTTSSDHQKIIVQDEKNKEARKLCDAPTESSARDISHIRKVVESRARDLANSIQKHQSYQGFPTEETAILMLCGYGGKTKLGKLDRDKWLYLEGTLNGMSYVLEHHDDQSNEELTGEYLVTLQKEFLPKEYIKGDVGDITEMIGFRKKGISIAIENYDGNTDVGYQEWKKQCEEWNENSKSELHNIFMTKDEIDKEPGIRVGIYSENTLAVIVCDEREEPQLKKAADYFFQACDKDMKEAKSDNEKLSIIARTVSWLAKGQLLNDANCRTIGYGILPKLLLKYHLEPTIVQDPQIFKTRSISEIQWAIWYGQQRFAFYQNQNKCKQYLELIETDTFQVDSFEMEFHKERKMREEFFNGLESDLRKTIISAYNSYNVYKVLEGAKKKIDTLPKEQLGNDPDEYYATAKSIGEHIENFFIDRNYTKESSMASLYNINTKIGKLYKKFLSLKEKHDVFGDLCHIYDCIKRAAKEATKSNRFLRPYAIANDTLSFNSAASNNLSVKSDEEWTSYSPNKSPSLVSQHSQMIDIAALPID